MKKTTYIIIGILVLILVCETVFLIILSTTGRPWDSDKDYVNIEPADTEWTAPKHKDVMKFEVCEDDIELYLPESAYTSGEGDASTDYTINYTADTVIIVGRSIPVTVMK